MAPARFAHAAHTNHSAAPLVVLRPPAPPTGPSQGGTSPIQGPAPVRAARHQAIRVGAMQARIAVIIAADQRCRRPLRKGKFSAWLR